MIWEDMSYNQFLEDFIDKFKIDLKENNEEEDKDNEFNKANSFVFYSN